MLNRLVLETKIKSLGYTISQIPGSLIRHMISKRAILILFLITGIGIVAFKQIDRPGNKTQASLSISETPKLQLKPAKVTITLNKEFTFPVRDDKGQEVAKIKYVIDGVEKRDEILVKGQRATAIAGRTFLIINLKITNDGNQKIQINTRDYMRLSINGSSELLAPDIHNDPVEVQAISTKYTRVGFPIMDSNKSLRLQIGEIKQDKTTIDLNF